MYMSDQKYTLDYELIIFLLLTRENTRENLKKTKFSLVFFPIKSYIISSIEDTFSMV
jgi:hypothetical protein